MENEKRGGSVQDDNGTKKGDSRITRNRGNGREMCARGFEGRQMPRETKTGIIRTLVE